MKAAGISILLSGGRQVKIRAGKNERRESQMEAWEERRIDGDKGWRRMAGKGKDGKAFFADKKNFWLSWLIMKKATEDRSCTLIFEVNSVQCLLLCNAFLAKQWGIKLEITSHLSL